MTRLQLQDVRFRRQYAAGVSVVMVAVGTFVALRAGAYPAEVVTVVSVVPTLGLLVATLAVINAKLVAVDDGGITSHGVLPRRRRIPWSEVTDIGRGEGRRAHHVVVRHQGGVLRLTGPAGRGARPPSVLGDDDYATLLARWKRWRKRAGHQRPVG